MRLQMAKMISLLLVLLLLSGCGAAPVTAPKAEVEEPVETQPVETDEAETVPPGPVKAEIREAEKAATEAPETEGPKPEEAETLELGTTVPEITVPDEKVYINAVSIDYAELKDEAVALSDSAAALPKTWEPVASGTLTKKNNKAVVDYSNTKDGYVMVQFTASTTKRLKAQVAGPTTTYTYDITPGKWVAFPLSDGNGSYKVTVFENVTGTKYSATLSASFSVTLKDEFAPFLRSNQYVDFAAASKSIEKAAELVKGKTKALEKVAAVYDYVVKNISYDKAKAATVKSGYLPVLDTVLSSKKGICFDYAALMTGMLRSQSVPCKLVVGYAGKAYHAWISVWSAETGWIDSAIYFDGSTWHRMDPTFASSGKQSASIMAYIGDGKNYSAKYFY